MDIVDAIAQRDSARAVRLVRDYNRKVADALNDAGLGPHLLDGPPEAERAVGNRTLRPDHQPAPL